MDNLLGLLNFFGSSAGLATIGMTVAALIVVWDWRLALAGLVLVQVGVAAATVALAETSSDWAGVMVAVMLLCALMLAISAQRSGRSLSQFQAGTWQLRALTVGIFFGVWRLANLRLPVPTIDPALVELFVWLTFCMLIMLGLSESPLFTATALLLWLIPAQTVAAILVGAPVVMALIGFLALLLALGGSYLILVEQVAAQETAPAITDIAFPPELEQGQVPRVAHALGASYAPPAHEAQAGLPAWLLARWAQGRAWVAARRRHL
jgi:uncharacterized membrane protein